VIWHRCCKTFLGISLASLIPVEKVKNSINGNSINGKVLRLILFSKIFLVMLGGDRMIGEKKIKKEVNTGSGI